MIEDYWYQSSPSQAILYVASVSSRKAATPPQKMLPSTSKRYISLNWSMLVELNSLRTKHPPAKIQVVLNGWKDLRAPYTSITLMSFQSLRVCLGHRLYKTFDIPDGPGAYLDRAFFTMLSIFLNLTGSKLNGGCRIFYFDFYRMVAQGFISFGVAVVG